jgi:hypothetical protein
LSTDAVGYRFKVLPGLHAVCRLPAGTPVPSWAAGKFVSITSTADELSIMCPAERVPAETKAERDWRVLKVIGPFPFSAVGVMSAFATPLAAAGISLLAVATFETDYLLVKAGDLERARAALTAAGHRQVA